jgi:calmodulin
VCLSVEKEKERKKKKKKKATVILTLLQIIGTIETHELKQVITQLGDNPTDEEIDDMIIAVDTNGDGEIDFEEFLALMRLRMGESGDDAENHLREVFDMFDTDGSGCIDRNEMRTL